MMRSVDLGGQVPTELHLMPIGKWSGYIHPIPHEMQTFEISQEHIRAAVEHNRVRKERNPQRDLVIDYEHATIFRDTAPAAGFIGNLRDGGSEGLIATDVRWTAKAKAHIEAGEYRYISPVFAFDRPDKVTGNPVKMVVYNAGLTNEPFFDELKPLTSKDGSHNLYIFSSLTFPQEDTMDKLLQVITAFLGLAATATPDDVVAKVNPFIEQLRGLGIVAKQGAVILAGDVVQFITDQGNKLKTAQGNYALVAKALGAVETDPVEKLTAMIASAKDKTGFVARSEFDALQARFSDREVDEIIAGAMAKGKISPATKDSFRALALKDREAFTDLMEKTPEYSAVPLQKTETGHPIRAAVGLTDEDNLVAKQMGTTEQLKKYATATTN